MFAKLKAFFHGWYHTRRQLVATEELCEQLMEQVDAINNAMVLQQREYNATLYDNQLTIACLVAVGGGKMTVTTDLIEAMKKQGPLVDYRPGEGTVMLELVIPEENEENESE
jgi:hypothetical protein